MQSLIWILDTIRQDQDSDLNPSAVILVPGLIFLAGENRSNYLGFMAAVLEQIARRAPAQLFANQHTFVEYLFKNIEQLVAKPDSDPLGAIFSNLTLSRESLDYVVQNIINGQHPLKEKIMAPILDHMVRTEQFTLFADVFPLINVDLPENALFVRPFVQFLAQFEPQQQVLEQPSQDFAAGRQQSIVQNDMQSTKQQILQNSIPMGQNPFQKTPMVTREPVDNAMSDNSSTSQNMRIGDESTMALLQRCKTLVEPSTGVENSSHSGSGLMLENERLRQ